MHGWVEPEAKVFGTVDICGFPSDLATVPLWDAHPEGRVGQVYYTCPKEPTQVLDGLFFVGDSIQMHGCPVEECGVQQDGVEPNRPGEGIGTIISMCAQYLYYCG